MGDMPIGKLLFRLSPPVMLALLIQSIYNIVDSYFVAQYSLSGLTALSLVFPIQLLATALSTGAGTGLGILIARMDGCGDTAAQRDTIKSGLWLGVFNFALFACVSLAVLQGYFALSSDQPMVRQQGIQYAQVVLAGSLGLFVESHCTKLLQARGNTLVPMLAQVTGAAINIVLDPILIFGRLGAPALGVTGAALATVAGQWAAMAITLAAVCRSCDLTGRVRLHLCAGIYRSGLAPIAMQSLNTLYIVGLNLILKQFTEDAVTVLGLYYKLQTFFFIPLMGLQQVIVPVVSFNHSAGAADHLPQFPARRHRHDADRLFPGVGPEQAEHLHHRAAAGGAAGAAGLGVPLCGADVRLADLPRDRSAVGALCAGFLPGRAFSVKTPKCRIIF